MENSFIINELAIAQAIGTHTGKNTKKVLCISTFEIFSSVADAAQENNVTAARMCQALQGSKNGSTCKGKRFCYLKDILLYIDELAGNFQTAVNYEEIQKREREAEILERIRLLETKLAKRREEYRELMEAAEKKALQIKMIEAKILEFEAQFLED